MAVLDPVKIVIENFAEGEVEMLSAPNHNQLEKNVHLCRIGEIFWAPKWSSTQMQCRNGCHFKEQTKAPGLMRDHHRCVKR